MNTESPGRELLHKRDFAFEGYKRADGHYDIEGRMTDEEFIEAIRPGVRPY